MRVVIRGIQYNPGKDEVAVLLEYTELEGMFYVNVTQSELPPVWDDADILTAVQAQLDTDSRGQLGKVAGKGHIAVMPEPVPAPEPPAPDNV